jgi:hypothetical protein
VFRPQITHKSARTGTITQEPQHLWLHDLKLGVETAVRLLGTLAVVMLSYREES